MPLSKVTDAALVELQVSIVDEPRMIEVACAVSVNVGAGCGPGVDCGAFEQAVKATTSSRVATLRNIDPGQLPGDIVIVKSLFKRLFCGMLRANGCTRCSEWLLAKLS